MELNIESGKSAVGVGSPKKITFSRLSTVRSAFTLTVGCGKIASPNPVEIFESGDTLVGTLLPPM